MNKFFYTLIFFFALSSCSEYQKALKAQGEEATVTKFKMGEALYEEGKFAKANRLFAQIVPNYRGKPQAQKLMFLYSDTFYQMKDYYTAGYQFERFVSSYPKSEKVEYASFLSAKSYYQLSPVYSKDQKETKEAITKLQNFINLFPNSQYVQDANALIKQLDFKLEKKAYEIAKQYNHISDYPASVRSFDNFIFDFPGSKLREDAFFYRLDSAFKLAIRSVEVKRSLQKGLIYLRKQRLETAQEYADTFKKNFTDSKYIEAVNEMDSTITEQLEVYSTKS